MKNTIWLITAKTNLHVGNENTSSYGLIDKSVQRDVVTGLPCINGSSLKGALNEFMSHILNKDTDFLIQVFGSDKVANDENKRKKDVQKGAFSFFDAKLLTIPVQSNNRLFYRATSPGVLKDFVDQLNLFGNEYEEYKFDYDLLSPAVFTEEETELGDYKANKQEKNELVKRLEELIGTDIALFNDADFKELCSDDNLPIIARNKLDNGESKNLWYEQIVPQETVFYSVFLSTDNTNLKDLLDDKIVQIGANATIGMGYCKFKLLNLSSHE